MSHLLVLILLPKSLLCLKFTLYSDVHVVVALIDYNNCDMYSTTLHGWERLWKEGDWAGGGDQVVSGEGDEPTEQEVKDRLEDELNQQLKV